MSQPSGGSPTRAALTAAWQQVLQTEYAAVFGYGIVGPYLAVPNQAAQARAFEQAHRERRDTIMSQLAVEGTTPDPAAPFYPPDQRITDSKTALSWALQLEQACAARYRFVLLASVTPATSASVEPIDTASRTRAIGWLCAAALAASTWRGLLTPGASTVAFPGS